VLVKVLASLSGAGARSILWTVPGLLASAFLVTWGAEAAQALIGQGLALALLAWLQTLPELGVEAVIAWQAGENPARAPLAIANLTGAIRLLVGLGWPLIYVVYTVAGRGRSRPSSSLLRLGRGQVPGVLGLVPALLYFAVILAKGTLTALDAGVLLACYAVFLALSARGRTPGGQTIGAMSVVSHWALAGRGWRRAGRVGGVCVAGATLLAATAHPFFRSMLATAAYLGLAPFLVVQWLAPVLTELPEMVSSVAWARRVTLAPMALQNLSSSAANQWTILTGMIPIIYGYAHWRRYGTWVPFTFDQVQRVEVLLALLQTGVGVALVTAFELGPAAAAGLFVLWIVQVAAPQTHLALAWTYGAWLVTLLVRWVARPRLTGATGAAGG
jgi:cation:H+ antiporter